MDVFFKGLFFMKNFIIISFLTLCILPLQAKEYSFDDAYKRVLATQESLAAARQEVKAAKAEQGSTRGLYFPSIGIKGSYTRINGPITIDLNEIRTVITTLHGLPQTALPPFEEQVQDEKFFKAQAYATLPLFTGGKIASANAAAKANYLGAQAQADMLANKLLVDLSIKYFGNLLTQKMMEVRGQFLQNAKQNAENGAKMFRAGVISKVEKMSVDVILAQAQRDYDSSVNDASIAQTLLKDILSETEEIIPNSSLFVLPLEHLPSLEDFQAKALSTPIFSFIDSKKALSKANENAQKADFLPTFYLFATRELYTRDLTILEPDWAVGVGFNWSLFEGGHTYHKTKAAQELTQKVEDLKAQQIKDILTGIEYYYKKMENAQKTYTALQEELAFTEEFYKARQLGFKAGTTTSLEVNMAMTQWQKSQLENLKAQYDFVTSLAAILNLSGQPELFNKYAQEGQIKE